MPRQFQNFRRRATKPPKVSKEIKMRPFSGKEAVSLLGFDVSTECIGWAEMAMDTGALLRHGKILVAGNSEFEKMDYARTAVLDLLQPSMLGQHPKNVVATGIEELNCFMGGDTVRKLAMIGGVVAMALYDKGYEPNWMNTGTCKAGVGAMPNLIENKRLQISMGWSKSSYTKKLTCHRVNEKYKTKFQWHSDKLKSEDDIADAVAVANALYQEINRGQL